MTTVALFGAGGKMGRRLAANLGGAPGTRLLPVEVGGAGREWLLDNGLIPLSADEALEGADAVVLALPDTALGAVSREIVPRMRAGALLVTLDPAAAHAGALARREGVPLFVTHPCHPPLFGDETGEARRDYFGGTLAKQGIVCAIEGGSDEEYARGEALARAMYAPVTRSHRITVEAMAILEPAMAETVVACLATIMGEALEEAVARGVPREAARDFFLGHVQIPLAIVLGEVSSPFSDGALKIIEYGRRRVVREDWRSVFGPEDVLAQVRHIVGAGERGADERGAGGS